MSGRTWGFLCRIFGHSWPEGSEPGQHMLCYAVGVARVVEGHRETKDMPNRRGHVECSRCGETHAALICLCGSPLGLLASSTGGRS